MRQLLRHRRRHEIRAGRRDLAHLHEHPAALLERMAEPPRERHLPCLTVLGVTTEPEGRAESVARSEEHTSELQSPDHLVCRLLLEKKKKRNISFQPTNTNDT